MNKKFTDIFICRPVLAIVVSLLLMILGTKSLMDLPIRQYPKMDNTLITITTSYPGAPASLIEGFITKRIEASVASAEGIDYMDSTSTDSVSTINLHVKLNFDPNVAFTDAMSKVTAVQDDLPKEAQLPVMQKINDSSTALLYIAYSSDTMSPEQITDYISRVVQPKIETVPGVAQVNILGGMTFSMRVWLDTKKMAAWGITPNDVVDALKANNFQSAAGQTKGDFIQMSITAKTDAVSAQTFNNLVVKTVNGTLIRIRDIGKAELGSETYDSSVFFNGEKAIFISITSTSTANPLTVVKGVKDIMPQLKKVYPPTLDSKIVYDATKFINASIEEVISTIFEASIIVVFVIFLFLGSLRTVLIPVVTIPLSLIGVCFFMSMLGYSVNLLTLLAMVLAIGLVVDDAIVVVENIYRHIEEGLTPFKAAIRGAREIATAVISMTITLAAVYMPIGFMTGLTGALFTEFAFTLAGSVIVSGIIALTLSPMMCSKLLNDKIGESAFVKKVDKMFDSLKKVYHRALHAVLNVRSVVVVIAIVVLSSCFYLYVNTSSELAPKEDQGVVFVQGMAPMYANINYVEQYTKPLQKIYGDIPALEDYFIINGMSDVNTAFSAIILKPWDERKQSQQDVATKVNKEIAKITGLKSMTNQLPSLPGAGNTMGLQFIINSVVPFEQIFPVAQKLANEAKKSGLFIYVDNLLKFNKPELIIDIDRGKAGELGVTMSNIGMALAYSLGGNYINRFPLVGQSYKVIPRVGQVFRLNPDDVMQIYVASKSGDLVPLSTIAKISLESQPNSLTHFQQLNSTTILTVMAPGHTTGEGLAFLEQKANELLPKEMSYDFAGQLRQYVQEGSTLIITFFLSIIIIYLVLAAQFESFRDPFTVLVSVPMSICGALIVLNIGFSFNDALTINIYTQVGLITLVGLISKHGILMVEFANQLQEEKGLSIREAIEESAATRLRPILMTTAAMVLGVVPLILASGAGAKSRFAIGVVIAAGMLIGTCFTLFVVPTMYTFFAKKHIPLKKPDDD